MSNPKNTSSSGIDVNSAAHEATAVDDSAAVTAAVLLIGNELLNGRTQDTNLATIATALGQRGIRVMQARVIADDADTIVNTLNELRARYSYVFTTGGIGPTHDDITAENVARAFGVQWSTHAEAERLLLDYFKSRDVEPNEARMRMAKVPEGATLVDNPVSIAPGFCMGNVYVMAGVPKIMQSMLQNILPQLPDLGQMHSTSVVCDLPEGLLAAPLGRLQQQYPNVDLGSYPGKDSDIRRVALVARGHDESEVSQVAGKLEAMVAELGGSLLE